MSDDNEQISQRRAKLATWRTTGAAYPNDFRPNARSADLHSEYGDMDGTELDTRAVQVALAGRLMSKRVMGKASFAHLQDDSDRIQLFLQRDALAEGVYNQAFKKWDIGDIIGVRGTLFKTKTGELSVKAHDIRLLTKALRPLPEKFHGLADQEIRYRRRYVDLIMNRDSRGVFELRSSLIRLLREFLHQRRFIEVETPMMQAIPGGAVARPFVTHHNALDMDLYLRVAPELYLKRLVVGGFERVFELNRNFRNEGVSTQHNPEFTMLEFYQAYADYHDLMDLTEQMFREVAEALRGDNRFDYQGETLDFGSAFARMSVAEAVLQHNPELDETALADRERLAHYARTLQINAAREYGPGKLLTEIFDKTVEHQLRQPTFITAYPKEVSPLSRCNDDDPELTDRFELFIAGREIANGFSELNDPEDQAERFQRQVEEKDAGDEEAMHYDADYVRALEYGMPPTAGEGIGIDRLVMLLSDSASIRDVLLFPHMRPETG